VFTDRDEVEEYDLSVDRTLIRQLNIELGTNKLPRYSCACHKNNIAVRMAIKKHSLTRTLVKLSHFAGITRRTIRLAQIHIKKKCRLRTENLTRWSSSYMMLVSYKKAYDRDAFSENQCPVEKKTIESYIQILAPAYDFNLLMQRNLASIADVNPSLILMFAKWESMTLKNKNRF
jgi:hypothetical protein